MPADAGPHHAIIAAGRCHFRRRRALPPGWLGLLWEQEAPGSNPASRLVRTIFRIERLFGTLRDEKALWHRLVDLDPRPSCPQGLGGDPGHVPQLGESAQDCCAGRARRRAASGLDGRCVEGLQAPWPGAPYHLLHG